MKICPNCNKEMITVYDYCGDCGKELEIKWRYICSKCGHKSGQPDKFCVACGSPLFIKENCENT